MSKPVPVTYRTTNWRAYNAALRQRGSLVIWSDPQWSGWWRREATAVGQRPSLTELAREI